MRLDELIEERNGRDHETLEEPASRIAGRQLGRGDQVRGIQIDQNL